MPKIKIDGNELGIYFSAVNLTYEIDGSNSFSFDYEVGDTAKSSLITIRARVDFYFDDILYFSGRIRNIGKAVNLTSKLTVSGTGLIDDLARIQCLSNIMHDNELVSDILTPTTSNSVILDTSWSTTIETTTARFTRLLSLESSLSSIRTVCSVAISLYQASDFFMSGFIFNGTAYPISATSCTTLTFRDLTFINTGQKIFSVHGCSEVQISNCISNSSEGVLLVDANSYNLNISDSTFKGIQGTAFVSNDSKFINIIDNQIEMGGANVGSRLMTSTNGYGNSFRGNTYYDGKPSTGFSPIYLLNHSGYRLIGNYLADSSPTVYTAVEKSNSYSCIFSSNTFFGYDATSGSINGLDVTDSAIGNVF